MSPFVARAAVMQRRMHLEISRNGKCSPLLVQLAARKQEYRFSREKTVRYIAANALQKEENLYKQMQKPVSQLGSRLFYLRRTEKIFTGSSCICQYIELEILTEGAQVSSGTR